MKRGRARKSARRKYLEAAAGVGGGVAEQARPHGVGETGAPSLGEAVATALAVAGDQDRRGPGRGHVLAGRGEEARDIRRIVLAVAVQGGDPFAARCRNTRDHRHALAGLLAVAEHAQGAAAFGRFLELRRGRVSTAVVNGDDLEAHALEHGGDLVDQRPDIAGLVVHRDDHREERRRLGGGNLRGSVVHQLPMGPALRPVVG